MEPVIYLPYNHNEMDSAPEWWAKCIEVAKFFATLTGHRKSYVPPEAPDTEVIKDKAEESIAALQK
jgi:hypothetical protein